MRSELETTQRQFTAWIRDPAAAPCPPDVPPRRMEAYRELVTTNVESAINACFPVSRELIDDSDWQDLIQRFFTEYRCRSPIYRDIPGEFLKWLETGVPVRLKEIYPFILELTHYEWMELALDIDSAEIPENEIEASGDLLAGIPVLSPLARLLTYRFPVHQIGPEFLPTEPGPADTRLIMVRHRSHEIGFLEVNPLVARLVEVIGANMTLSGSELLSALQKEYPSIPEGAFQQGGMAALHQLRERDILLGTRR